MEIEGLLFELQGLFLLLDGELDCLDGELLLLDFVLVLGDDALGGVDLRIRDGDLVLVLAGCVFNGLLVLADGVLVLLEGVLGEDRKAQGGQGEAGENGTEFHSVCGLNCFQSKRQIYYIFS